MHSCFVEDQEKAGDEEEDECGMEDLEEDVVAGPRVNGPPKKISLNTVFPTLSDCHSFGMCAGKEGVTYDEEASNVARLNHRGMRARSHDSYICGNGGNGRPA